MTYQRTLFYWLLISFACCLEPMGVFAAETDPGHPKPNVILTPTDSRVPRFSFSETLANQEQELAENPLLKRFAASREKQRQDRHLPIYHFTSPDKQLNDPNGLCYWQGRWHLFYQAYPPENPVQHWGHAVSKDLIHWRDLPYSIYPGPEEKCFSGSCWVEEDRVLAFYRGIGEGRMLAISNDPLLLNWEKPGNKAVIPDGQPGAGGDAFLWKEGDTYYGLSQTQTLNQAANKYQRQLGFIRSKDLLDWEYLHPFIENDIYSRVGGDGACPYFYPIGKDGKYMLLHFSHMWGSRYLVGDFDPEAKKFIVTDGGDFCFGSVNFDPARNGGLIAPSAFSNPNGDGSIIAIWNVNTGGPTEDFDQCMTLPRRLTWDQGNALSRLGVEPYGDIESLRGAHVTVNPQTLPANEEVVFEQLRGNALEVELEIEAPPSGSVELNVLRSRDAEEYTRILLMKRRGLNRKEEPGMWSWLDGPVNSGVVLDTTRSSMLPGAVPRLPESAQLYLEPDENFKLRVFIDKSIVEVFVNGKQALASRAYPGRQDSTGVSLVARGSEAKLVSLDSWEMKSIYE